MWVARHSLWCSADCGPRNAVLTMPSRKHWPFKHNHILGILRAAAAQCGCPLEAPAVGGGNTLMVELEAICVVLASL
jgi:hypothetical protein